MTYVESNGHVSDVTMTSCDPERCCEAVRSAILAIGCLLVLYLYTGCIPVKTVALKLLRLMLAAWRPIVWRYWRSFTSWWSV